MSQPQADALTAQVVEEYLRDNPDFFKDKPELIDHLALPHQQMGAVSLVHVQMSRQRQRIEELEEEITALMSLAANNDKTFHEFMELQEQLLNCEALCEVVAAIKEKAQELGLTAYLRLLDHRYEPLHISRDNWQRFATNHFNGKDAYLGRLRKSDCQRLLGEHVIAPELGSFVVLPLTKGQPQGVLAFSSADGGHFQPHMDTLFLRHLALVVSHLIDTLPWQLADEERFSQPSA
ncbi:MULTISPECIES: DUF484 family protein [Vibrio]|uniref:DUF484 family protein n=2 Tax=Vibrio TaxID=662 RepID=A0A7X4LMI6_9VIBR|nr:MULTISPECIES: DUF484 family protein [Vibrio]MBF9001955.1 DUF484 family protein [Vibrio nitrifigilis]MZI94505.1 DUF484 family protein [Vibrio eleionomae]